MEGTSGAAERDLLRGRAREAALSDEPTAVGRRRRRRASVARQANSNRVHDGGSGGAGVSSRRSPRVRDMRCPSRSGWGEAFTESDLGGRCRTSRPSCLGSRPLARDFSAGFRAARSGGHPQLGDAARRSVESEAAPAGDRGRGTAGFGRPWSCSRSATIAEVDGRRAALLAHERRARGSRRRV